MASAQTPAQVAPQPTVDDLLRVDNLSVGYDGRPVVYDASFRVARGEVVTLFGSNGAGKTTTLKAIVGLLRPLSGSVLYDGVERVGRDASRGAADGISLIPAERFTFADLSVDENLSLGAYSVSSADTRQMRRDRALELFPRLKDRLRQKAGTMSGGEQRMLSIAMALMAGPRLLLLDEPSLGLAPTIVEQVMGVVRQLRDDDGMSVVMVEQNVVQALRIADRAYVMRSGRILLEAEATELRKRDEFWEMF